MHYAVNGVLNMPPHHITRYSDKTLQKIAEIFDLKLLGIYHEAIQKEHIDFYKSTIFGRIIGTPLVDRSLKRKLWNRLGKICKWAIPVPKNAYRHTAVAIYAL